PYLMHERPDLKEKLDGFTYYPNTVSYGAFTNTGIPALFGGSEYRPEQLNERSSELLRDKHNESLQVLPKIFSDHGFGVTLFDPSYANYQWTPDLSVFDDIPNTKAYITMDGSFTDNESLTKGVHGGGGTQSDPARTFFCHGLFKTAPVVLQPLIYSSGTYNSATALSAANALSGNGTDADREVTAEMLVKQLRNDAHVGVGVDMYFTRAYGVLKSMPQITDIVDDDQGQYFLMTNDSAHQPMILVEPSYEPALWTDNTVYDEEHRVRTDGAGGAIEFPEESGDREYSRLLHYEVNMASLLALGEWFDYLREQGVWDNTRVIICSDHSRQLWTEPDMTIDAVSVVDHEHWDLDLLVFNCLFMVKDFGAQGFTVDESFMTNADTPVMALKDVVEHPVNPFTGGRIDSSYKDEPEQRILYYPYWDVEGSTDKTFGAGLWYSVRDDVRVRKNWEYLGTY
ncbi:MAG: hypothetical protein IJ131_04610, partial [Eggerthellaceae bacterium]|nr:hypothetical protein [Eggerthellaceae bacterium]